MTADRRARARGGGAGRRGAECRAARVLAPPRKALAAETEKSGGRGRGLKRREARREVGLESSKGKGGAGEREARREKGVSEEQGEGRCGEWTNEKGRCG